MKGLGPTAVALAVGVTLVFLMCSRAQRNVDHCGAAALWAVSRELGQRMPYGEIRHRFNDSTSASDFAEIQTVANSIGLQATGTQTDFGQLRSGHQIGVAHLRPGHFVAVVGYTSNGVIMVDPTIDGQLEPFEMPRNRFQIDWSGRFLVISRRLKVGELEATLGAKDP